MQGLAATQSFCREQTSAHQTMRQQRLLGIFRAAWSKAATRTGPKQMLERRQEKLIAAHQPGRKAGRKGGALF
jgi:hypothetical protein